MDAQDEPRDDPAAPPAGERSGGAEPGGGDHRGEFRRAARLTSLFGIAFAMLFTVGLYLLTATPGPRASDQTLAAFYAGGNRRWIFIGGLYLVPFSAVAFLWFIAAVRRWAELSGRPVDHLLSTVQSFSGVGFITLVFAAAGAATVVAASIDLGNTAVDPVLARQFPLYGQVLLMVFGLRMAAIFVTATANIGHRAGIYPRWFAYGSYAVAAVLFLTASLNRLLVLVFPLWVVVLCGLIWTMPARTAERAPAKR
ncbi:MAG TPA: hypothetical protein VFI22_10745 [Thermomicrobiales bacterium]|nr:hypothetical protein [Thermomicrobiales bacterium]